MNADPTLPPYAQRRAASLLLPPVDLRQLIDPTVRAQGPRPLCLPFAMTVAHEAARSLTRGDRELLAVEPLWQHCVQSRNAGDHGTTLDAIGDALLQVGQPSETVWPYNPSLGAYTEPTPMDAVAAVFNTAESFEVPLANDGIEESIETALNLGLAVVLVLEITSEFEGAATDGEILAPSLNSPIGDYHAVTVLGAATNPEATTRRLVGTSVGSWRYSKVPKSSSPSLPGAEAMSASTTWADFQAAQVVHDRQFHPDVFGLSKIDQLRHYTFHVTKLAGLLIDAVDSDTWSDFARDRLADLAIFGVKIATACNDRLPVAETELR